MTTYYDPFRELVTFNDTVQRLLQEATVRPGYLLGRGGDIPMNIAERDGTYILQVALPGVKPEDIEVTEQQRTITIKAKRERLLADGKDHHPAGYLLLEFDSSEFLRSVTLPKDFESDRSETVFEHGVLTITLPLAPHAKSKRIAITNAAHPKELVGPRPSKN